MPTRCPDTPVAIIVDSGELWPHPWRHYAPDHVQLRRGKLATGSLAVAGGEDGAVVRRLTAGELLTRIGKDRARFEAELQRGRYVGRYVVVIEGTFEEMVSQAPRARPVSIIGSLAAWTRRYCPFQFCGTAELAASFAFRFLIQPHAEAVDFAAAVDRMANAPADEGSSAMAGKRTNRTLEPGVS